MSCVQSALIAELTATLASVPDFGQLVFEDSIIRLLDEDDPDLPDHFIVLQQSGTREVERVGKSSIRESTTVTLVLVTRVEQYGSALRAGRLSVKRLLSGRKCGLNHPAVQAEGTGFQEEQLRSPGAGQRFAAYAMPLQIGYVQTY